VVTAADGVRCMLMRGGTSKGLFFLASDLPGNPAQRDALLLAIMGSGHPLQVDGAGGAELLPPRPGSVIDVEHPTGHLHVEVELDTSADPPRVLSAGVIRTARKLFDGAVYPADYPPGSP
jgi:2-methylaconitate cis-trans-isomerase PrpF